MFSSRFKIRPPILAQWFLALSVEPENREVLLGDFSEFFREKFVESGRFRAHVWYWGQVFRSLPHLFSNFLYWSAVMIRNYLTVTLRNLRKNKVNSVINIGGLAIGISCCILIFYFVRDELSYDRFHKNVDTIFEIKGTLLLGNMQMGVDAQPPLAPVLPEQFPEILSAVRIARQEYVVRLGRTLSKQKGIAADPDFFQMFSFPLKDNVSTQVLNDPHAVVLSEPLARKLFGGRDPVGQNVAIRLNDEYQDFQVAAVAERIPTNSSLKFDFVVNLEKVYGAAINEWNTGKHVPTFVQLAAKHQAEALAAKFPGTIDKQFRRTFDEKSGYQLYAFADYHLRGERDSAVLEAKSRTVYSLILASIALLVLLIACFNFMNLTIGNASTRLQEIGVRKVLGAGRRQLIRQFWFESQMMSLAALAVGALLAQLILPVFNVLSQKSISPGYFQSPVLWGFLLGLALLVGGLAGSYPALVLSHFESVKLFRGKIRFTGRNLFSRMLITLQFSISIFLIVATVVVFSQNRFLSQKDLGYDSDQIVVVPLEDLSMEKQMQTSFFPSLKNRLLQHKDILAVTGAQYGLANFWMSQAPELKEEGRVILDGNKVDYDYISTLGLTLLQGRDFSRERSTDLEDAVLVNETFVNQFGLDSPLGKKLGEPFKQDLHGTIIGVVKDFHYQSLHNPIRPAYIRLLKSEHTGSIPPPARLSSLSDSKYNQGFRILYVKIKGRDLQRTLGIIKNEFQESAPSLPFEFRFLDQTVAQQYALEMRWSRIINTASIFAVLIACSGLFGLTLLSVARRTKEIGIRKVLGASLWHISKLINREFVWLVGLANLIAWPAATFAMQALLQNYAFRIRIQFWMYLLSAGIALAIAVLTVSSHAIRAARTNPVESLRYE